MKSRYLISCAAAALVCAGGNGAFAADAAAAAASDSATAVTEVVVTAERRSESVQKVPSTVQAFTGDTLKQLNVTSFDDLIKYTPNVTFATNAPGQGNIYMRGLSTGFTGTQSSAALSGFPNVAVYLDDQSMQFPSRNADIYVVDMERVEILEGPQGTLFGGGAQAGAVRYITNKPKLDKFEADMEVGAGLTADGGPNYNGHFMVNIPVVKDTFAIRAVVYDDHHGGYIDNVPSTFTRNNGDLGNHYIGIKPNGAGICPNGLPAAPVALNGGYCTTTNAPVQNNFNIAAKNQNPVDYFGARVEALWDITPDWNLLVSESYQKLDVYGISSEEPIGSDFQPLAPLQTTYFTPSWSHDEFYNTAWTVNGKIGPLRAVYTGAYTVRHINQQQDYSSYSRAPFGTYYQCAGGHTYYPAPQPTCYSTDAYWTDKVRNTHLTEEFRISSPDTWRLRFIAGGYWEQFKLHDNQDYDYYSIPRCTAEALAAEAAGGPSCGGFTGPIAGSTLNEPGLRGPNDAFGDDLTRSYDQTAAFVSVDFDIIPNKLTISGGTRWYQYTETEVGSVFWTFGYYCANVPVCVNPGSGSNIDLNHDKVTYVGFKSRANLTWHVTQDVLAYFTFSQGFRPGFFNRFNDKEVALDAAGQPQFREPNSVAPDTLTNYEVGIKSQLFDHRLLLNISAYDMNWDNVQLNFFNPQALGNTAFAVNGPNYNVKGFEFQFVGKPAPQWTITGSGSYNHATQTNSPCFVSNIVGSPTYGSCILQAINTSSGQLVSLTSPFGTPGSVPAFSPAFQGNIRVRYDFEIGEYKCYATLGGNYMGGMWNQPATYPSGDGVTFPYTTLLRYYQPAYATLDASVGVTRDNLRFEVYGTNLTNSHASTFTSSAEFIKSEVPIRPLVVGFRAGASF